MFFLFCKISIAAETSPPFQNKEIQGKPLITILIKQGVSMQAKGMTLLFTKSLKNIIRVQGIFDRVKSNDIVKNLVKFNCLNEKCISRAIQAMGINILITGKISYHKKYYLLEVKAIGTKFPYNGKYIYHYKTKIPIIKKMSPREFAYIAEEHSGFFMSKILKHYKLKIPIIKKSSKYICKTPFSISGNFSLYRFTKDKSEFLERYKKIKKIKIRNSVVEKPIIIKKNDFIFYTFDKKSKFLVDFYKGRKKEIVFGEPSYLNSLYVFLLTAPISALMPLTVPYFGYYKNKDWLGLSMWALNFTPYFYLEINGYVNNLPGLESSQTAIITKDNAAQYYFAFYMMFAGGTSLFVDAFAKQYLQQASNYQGQRELMGNPLTAGYLSLISGGGGLFYRGYRAWGYFYFHLNNLLVYFMMREFSSTKNFDLATQTYVDSKDQNYALAFSLLGVFIATKIVEVVHAVLIDDNISNGEKIISKGFFAPYAGFTLEQGISAGVQYTFNF